MKACVECHAGQTLTLNPPLQSDLFVDTYNHAVSSEKKKKKFLEKYLKKRGGGKDFEVRERK